MGDEGEHGFTPSVAFIIIVLVVGIMTILFGISELNKPVIVIGCIVSSFGVSFLRKHQNSRKEEDEVVAKKVLLKNEPVKPIERKKGSPAEEQVEAIERKRRIERVVVKRGYARAGEWIKLGVKIINKTKLVIHNVTVQIDEYPSALQYEVPDKNPMDDLQTINPGEFHSAIFRFRPTRCVDGSIIGSVRYTDVKGKTHTIDIEPIEVKSVCPMLTSVGVDRSVIVGRLTQGTLPGNRAFIEFEGNVRSVFNAVQARLGRLILYDQDWRVSGSTYIGNLFYLGMTTYANKVFAAEFLVSGTSTDRGGVTMTVYSDEPEILTGFFDEIVSDLKHHVSVLKETSDICVFGCGKCGGPLNLEEVIDGGYVRCYSCDFWNRIPKWKR